MRPTNAPTRIVYHSKCPQVRIQELEEDLIRIREELHNVRVMKEGYLKLYKDLQAKVENDD